ncbi:Hpt domain-containing protein [Hydrogenimonas sp.]
MLIYKNDGKLHCISKKALKLAGFNDVAQFLDEHSDYSELFVKKPGYIYKFENFSWLSFLRNANPDQKKVLIATRDDATYECELELELVYPVEFDENTPEFFYQIDFKNLHLANGTAATESFGEFSEESMAATIDLDSELIDREHEAFEPSAETAALFETPAEEEKEEEAPTLVFGGLEEPKLAPEPEAISFETPEEEEGVETLAFGTDTQEATSLEAPSFETPVAEEEAPAPKPADEPLELVDFTFDEVEEKTEEKQEAPTAAFDDDALANAFAELETPSEPKEAEAEEEAPAAIAPEAAKAEEETPQPPETGHPGVVPAPETPTAFAAMTAEEAQPSAAETPAPTAMELPDLKKAAAALGLPETMVKAFVKEFVDTYLTDVGEVKMAMASDHIAVVKKEAMKLKGIAANLMMEPLVASLESVLAAEDDGEVKAKWLEIDAYIHALGERFAPESVAHAPALESEVPAPVEAPEPPKEAKAPEAPKPAEAEAPAEAPAAAAPESAEASQKPLLEETETGETIAFDPNEAANALGLPESLIIEFVNDFVTQAREEKETFERAFADGDLKTVNEAAHKLKGVAANLRIEEMRELMEKAQHAGSLEEAKGPLVAFYKKLAALGNTMAKEFA